MEYIPGESSAAALNIDRIRRERKIALTQHSANVSGSSRVLHIIEQFPKIKKRVDEETKCKLIKLRVLIFLQIPSN